MANKKIKNYIDVLFSDVPKTHKVVELKEELTANMNERFEDYIAEGKSENQAYSLAVANMGDIDSLIADVMPAEGFTKEATHYRNRNATISGIATMLYILGPAALLTTIALDINPIFGVVILLGLVAVATGLHSYKRLSTPIELREVDENEKIDSDPLEMSFEKPSARRAFREMESIIWSLAVLVYLFIGFVFSLWHPGWIIFPVVAILMEIGKTILRLNTERSGNSELG